ncbi:ABC transporter ATP-binding protein/permease [Loktanella sp. D2R18]|uniref:ABC transporter ATP-binding protein n=1 Tax=Rhodobacterales TaxID=204455 RepID=UPI000DEB8724|nr:MULTISPECIES: ABC transporter ATP-binding protein [Rhodobacterales]MDO6592015.1 ABC transporter ATP-binding protein [Yoonia sp. 1_MG-2023]RBW44975.1 ABC transporter ATP-binding protein/permease [Loktanella sp. D2R18]
MMQNAPSRKTSASSFFTTFRQLADSVGPEAAPGLRWSLAGLVAAAAFQGFGLAAIAPLFTAAATDPDLGCALIWFAVMVVLMGIASGLRWFAQGFDFDGRMVRATWRLRGQLGAKLREIPLEQLQNKRAGELNSMVLGNVDENLLYALTVLNLVFTAIVTPLCAALGIVLFDWRLGLLLLLIFPAIVPLYRWRRPALGRGKRILGQAHQEASADVLEYTQGLAILRAAGRAGEKAERLSQTFKKLESIQAFGHRKGAKPNIIVASIVELGLVFVLGIGVWLVVAGSLHPATLGAIFVIVVRLSEPLSTFILYTAMLEVMEAALERIGALMATQPLPQTDPAQVPTEFGIQFHDVDFTYAQAETQTIRAFNADLPERSLTALVGPSGCGKTTLTRLLLRHFDPQHGTVMIGGVDLRQIPADRINSLISVVFQDVYLFNDTVLANIRMGRPDASDDDIRAAANAAQCLDFIERLPQGWQTPLGEIGGRLSGGERQRISIARALLKDAPIIVLDEPTAALDTESELAVQRALDALVARKTVIVIAHRLSTIVGADQILVIEDGALAQSGTHVDLHAQGGRYARMWAAQGAIKKWSVAS